MPESDLVGSVEAATIIGVDPSTIARWVERKRLTPVAKAPGRYGAFLFSRTQVQRLARERLTSRTSLRRAVTGVI